MSQIGWLVLGIAGSHAVFRHDPNTSSFGIGDIPAGPVAFFAVLLISIGISKGRLYLSVLEAGKKMSGSVLKIEEDNSGEDTEHRTSFRSRLHLSSVGMLPVIHEYFKRKDGDVICRWLTPYRS